jgi:MFS family permease
LVHPAAETAFGKHFWLTYVANSTMMVAVSLLFRYADYVKLHGGGELELGQIVGVGMVGSLLVRLAQGVGIDRYGPRLIWMFSTLLFSVSCLGHLLADDLHAPWVYAWRIAMQTAVAGFFGSSITFISGRAPVHRVAEVVGTLGTSGFVGMAIGTHLGDWLFTRSRTWTTADAVEAMFVLAAAVSGLSLAASWVATRGHAVRRVRRRLPVGRLLARYHPGLLLLVAVAMGFGLSLPATFVRPYAQELRISRIGLFFTVYPLTAFIMRLATARVPGRLGIRVMILAGLSLITLSMPMFLVVRQPVHLVVPALFLGAAHASLFPSVVAGGSGAFPHRYRGLGTTLVLAMFDLGNLIGAPTVGLLLHTAKRVGLAAYPTMFIVVACLLGSCGLVYAFLGSRSIKVPRRRRAAPRAFPLRHRRTATPDSEQAGPARR